MKTKVNQITCLLLIFVMSAVLKNTGELDVVKNPVSDRCFSEHLIDVVIGEPITHRGKKLAESLLVNYAVVLFIETTKRNQDDFEKYKILLIFMISLSDCSYISCPLNLNCLIFTF